MALANTLIEWKEGARVSQSQMGVIGEWMVVQGSMRNSLDDKIIPFFLQNINRNTSSNSFIPAANTNPVDRALVLI